MEPKKISVEKAERMMLDKFPHMMYYLQFVSWETTQDGITPVFAKDIPRVVRVVIEVWWDKLKE